MPENPKPPRINPRRHELAGRRFGHLLVIRRDHRKTQWYWLCRCDCGKEKVICQVNLTRGRATQCGCRDPRRTHGASFTPEYRAWKDMKARCFNPKNKSFKNYGARGITVCDRWRDSFSAFLADVGSRPGPGFSIDRRDNDGHYEPGNARWVEYQAQVNNQRKTIKVCYRGTLVPLQALVRMTGLNRQTVYHRIKYGWPMAKALGLPDGDISN